MSFLTKSSTTTALLSVIAVLLLIQVIQISARPTAVGEPAPPQMTNPHVTANMPGHNHPPFASGSAPGTGGDSEFDPAAMIFSAMVCPTDPTLTLDASGCAAPTAEERRELVRGEMKKNGSIRDVFDQIVAKYGEGALTAQAIEIRRTRLNQSAQ